MDNDLTEIIKPEHDWLVGACEPRCSWRIGPFAGMHWHEICLCGATLVLGQTPYGLPEPLEFQGSLWPHAGSDF